MKTDIYEISIKPLNPSAAAEKALKELRGTVEEVFQYSLGETKDDDCCVITVRKTAKTPDDYPRRFKKMKEEPLTD